MVSRQGIVSVCFLRHHITPYNISILDDAFLFTIKNVNKQLHAHLDHGFSRAKPWEGTQSTALHLICCKEPPQSITEGAIIDGM